MNKFKEWIGMFAIQYTSCTIRLDNGDYSSEGYITNYSDVVKVICPKAEYFSYIIVF